MMSDQSSIISISERMALSDTEDGQSSMDEHVDTRKYLIDNQSEYDVVETTGYAFDPLSREETPISSSSLITSSSGHRIGRDINGHVYGHVEDFDSLPTPNSRPESIFTLSRLSFTSQLAALTSIKLPNAVSLSHRISSLATSVEAAKALAESASQIQTWMHNALTVLRELDAGDDVEWAAAPGREGLADVDKAIGRFERVIKVYIFSVEELQMRDDISSLPTHILNQNVSDMELVLNEWQGIKKRLEGIKEQVEIAIEWDNLWDHVLGVNIGQELDDLTHLVFEMEERRHQTVALDPVSLQSQPIDIDDLRTSVERTRINDLRASVEETRTANKSTNPRHSLAAAPNSEDDLLGLFARMQPLRASLDFLPMRLAAFYYKGNVTFPSACAALEARRDMLEAQWKKLDADAESLRRELGEDRWLLVFRNAGRQALKMCESVSRTIQKMRSAIEDGEARGNGPAFARMIESYEAKKTHYAPAIERVLAIVDRGILDRLTVNGEILHLQTDMKRRWARLQNELRALNATLASLNVDTKNQQLRDSISTILSAGPSMAGSINEARSSSASSISARSSLRESNTAKQKGGPRNSSVSRHSSLNYAKNAAGTRHSPSTQSRSMSPTLTPVQFLRQYKQPTDKPRWNGSTSIRESGIGHNTTPLSNTEPSRHSSSPLPQRAMTPRSAPSRIPRPRSPSPRVADSPFYRSGSPATPSSRQISNPTGSPVSPRPYGSLTKPYNGLGRSNIRSNLSSVRSVTTPALNGRRHDFVGSNDGAAGSNMRVTRGMPRAPSAMALVTSSSGLLTSEKLRRRISMSTEDGMKPRWR